MFKQNHPVRFTGRSRLESHNISTVGVPGIVCSTHSSAPDGWVTVWVDWQNSEYSDLEDLPMWINTEPCWLEYIDEPKPAPKAKAQGGNVLQFPS